jgi:hypothetical protein
MLIPPTKVTGGLGVRCLAGTLLIQSLQVRSLPLSKSEPPGSDPGVRTSGVFPADQVVGNEGTQGGTGRHPRNSVGATLFRLCVAGYGFPLKFGSHPK